MDSTVNVKYENSDNSDNISILRWLSPHFFKISYGKYVVFELHTTADSAKCHYLSIKMSPDANENVYALTAFFKLWFSQLRQSCLHELF